MTVVLDSTPLGLLTQRYGVKKGDACKQWCAELVAAGARVLVPELADYEVRRELLRAGKRLGIGRLDAFNAAASNRYLPLSTPAVRLAAELWAKVRRGGQPTAADEALDGDVLIAAQALILNDRDVIVASENPKHIARFVPADLWSNIKG